MYGMIIVPAILLAALICGAESASPGVVEQATVTAAMVYSNPQLPQQLATAIQAKGG
jgi:hypothetical protein